MTDQFNKLADALAAAQTNIGPSRHKCDDYEKINWDTLDEAIALLRAAAGVDVAGLMAHADELVGAAARESIESCKGGYERQKTALESSLRLVLAQRVPQDYVLQLLVAAGHVTQEKVDQAIAIAAAAPQAKEQGNG